MAKTKTERLSELSMFGVTLVWGLGFPITSLAYEYGYEIFTILAWRFLVGCLILTVVFRKRLHLINRMYLIAGFVTGLFLFLGFYLQTEGLKYTSASNNAFLTQMAVIFTPFIQWMFIKKKPSIFSFLASGFAIIGVYFLIGSFSTGFNKGDIMTLGCAITVSLHVVITQYYISKHNLDPVLYTLMQFVFVALVVSILAFTLEEQIVFKQSVYYLWPLIFIGVFNTAIGFTIQSIAIKYLSSARTSIIVSTEALVATVASIIILHDKIGLNVILGGLMIIIAVIISETQLEYFRKVIKKR